MSTPNWETIELASSDAARLESHKRRVRQMRQDARDLCQKGAAASQVTSLLACQTETFLRELFEVACRKRSLVERELIADKAVMALVGGSGRGELWPYSDVDILFLFDPEARDSFTEVAAEVIRQGWDAGLRLGHAIRTVDETLQIAREEAQVASALTELRPVAGSNAFHERLGRFLRDRLIRRRLREFYRSLLAGRAKDYGEHGETSSILEPDVKRSAGGLRDVHLLRWLGSARFGTTDLQALQSRGAIERGDRLRLEEAYEFLSKVRIDLHFAAGRENDVLTRAEQQRIAAERDIPPTPGKRPVERFMQTYLQHASHISAVTRRFIARHRPHSSLGHGAEMLLTRRVCGVLWLGPTHVAIAPRYQGEAGRSPEHVLELFRIVAKSGVEPTAETEAMIRKNVANWPTEVSAEASGLFLAILSYDRHLGQAMRSMYGCGVLQWLIPDLAHARCLIQFNQYHSYTVDEHSFRAVEAAGAFIADDGLLGQARRAIRHPELLNLAVFLHDLGKGYNRDHSDVGREIAGRVAERLGMAAAERQTIETLVHKHLLLVHVALRRDITEVSLLVRLSREVQSPDTLRMLFVLGAADLKAVGPGVWTSWKANLLCELYEHLGEILSGQGAQPNEAALSTILEKAAHAAAHAAEEPHRHDLLAWARDQLEGFSRQYLTTTPLTRIVSDLQSLHALQPNDILTAGRGEPETGTSEYTVIVSPQRTDGCFYRVAATLAARRLEILSAAIETTRDGTVIERFRVIDSDHDQPIPAWRTKEIAAALREVLLRPPDLPRLIRDEQPYAADPPQPLFSELPSQVATDIHSSDRCTIIDVFAHDRPGLLFTLTQKLYDLGLMIEAAKISTHLDQVVDVFYITGRDGTKVTDARVLETLSRDLLAALQEFETGGHTQFTPRPDP